MASSRTKELIGPVQMRRDAESRFGFEAECHRCDWTLTDHARYTYLDLSEQWIREAVAWHLQTPHPNPWIRRVR